MEEKSVGAEIKKCEKCGRDATTVIMSGQAGEPSQYTYYCRGCNPNVGANPLKFTLPYKCAESAQEHEAQVDKALARAGFQEVAVNEDGSRKYIQNELVGAICVGTPGPHTEMQGVFSKPDPRWESKSNQELNEAMKNGDWEAERQKAFNPEPWKVKDEDIKRCGPGPEPTEKEHWESHTARKIREWDEERARHQAGYPDRHGVSVKKHDPVNHPSHYCAHPSGIECITITRHYNFSIGNAIKYLWRAGMKESRLQDLEKAAWYIKDEIQRLKDAGVKE